MIEARGVSFAYSDSFALQEIDLALEPGEMVGLVGPNGSGKSTLLKLCAGLLAPTRGEVRLGGRDLRKLSRRQIAQQVALVPQYFHIPLSFTVQEVVMLGRTPFLHPFEEDGREHRQVVTEAMEQVGIAHLEGRFFNELSGGERQKATLALALAQQPRLLLLDEPVAHLDIRYQVEIMEVVRHLNQVRGFTVLGVMHDLNLAALYFPRLILLKEGRIFAQGTPSQVLTPEILAQAFSAMVRVETHPTYPVPHIIILPPQDKLSG